MKVFVYEWPKILVEQINSYLSASKSGSYTIDKIFEAIHSQNITDLHVICRSNLDINADLLVPVPSLLITILGVVSGMLRHFLTGSIFLYIPFDKVDFLVHSQRQHLYRSYLYTYKRGNWQYLKTVYLCGQCKCPILDWRFEISRIFAIMSGIEPYSNKPNVQFDAEDDQTILFSVKCLSCGHMIQYTDEVSDAFREIGQFDDVNLDKVIHYCINKMQN